MDQNVGVTVPGQSFFKRNFNSAQDKLAPWSKLVYVVTRSDTEIVGRQKIVCVSQFFIACFSVDDMYFSARTLPYFAVVGIVAGYALVRLFQLSGIKALRSLHKKNAFAVKRFYFIALFLL